MTAVKGARIEAFVSQASTKVCPTVSASLHGSILVGLHGGLGTAGTETVSAPPPLQLKVQHNAVGTVTYSLAVCTAIAVEENLPGGTISGRTFVDATTADVGRVTASVLVSGGN